jgi:hypothetical protein
MGSVIRLLQSVDAVLDSVDEILGHILFQYDGTGHAAGSCEQDAQGFTETIESLFPYRRVEFFVEGQGDFMYFVVFFYFDPYIKVMVVMVTVAGHTVAVSVGPLTGLHDHSLG